jgi:hypothetical protein
LKAYDELVAASTVNAAQIGDVKKTDLPSEEALTTRQGKKEGDVMMVKNSVTGNVDAYQWSSANSEWINVGQVVDAVGSGRKQLYEGKEYDYVFDVDVSEGMPPLKLPFNVTRMLTHSFLTSTSTESPDTFVPFCSQKTPTKPLKRSYKRMIFLRATLTR